MTEISSILNETLKFFEPLATIAEDSELGRKRRREFFDTLGVSISEQQLDAIGADLAPFLDEYRYFPSSQWIVTTDGVRFSGSVWMGDYEISLPSRHCSYG
ncbi:hypothetical protein, partial [Haladaptatus sp. NG-WS-4]